MKSFVHVLKRSLPLLLSLVCAIAPRFEIGANAAPELRPLEEALNPDGTLSTSSGVARTFDARGWTLDSSSRQPRFTRADAASVQASVFGDQNWSSQFPGPPGACGQVLAVAVGPNGDVYIGGDFKFVIQSSTNTLVVNSVARWDGSGWSALGGGVNGPVYSLAVNDAGHLFAGGAFSLAGKAPVSNVARWNGSSWTGLGSGLNSTVLTLAVAEEKLYAGGYFSTAEGSRGIAVWNGASWSPVGEKLVDAQYGFPYVTALATATDGSLYALGQFTSIGNLAARKIARWNGTSWSALGTGLGDLNSYSYPTSLAAGRNDEVFVAGYISAAGGVPVNNVARWDGRNWSAMGNGLNNQVSSLFWNGSELFACGYFRSPDGKGGPCLAKWDGFQWSSWGNDAFQENTFPPLSALRSTPRGDLILGGDFTAVDGIGARGVARWDGRHWSALGAGANGIIYAVTQSDQNEIFVGGEFSSVAGVPARNVAKWSQTWSALPGANGDGTDGPVHALAWQNGVLYAGGSFTNAGGEAVSNIARWASGAWSPAGGGFDGPVRALLAADDGALYAGGQFSHSGASSLDSIARWNGEAWQPVGAGLQLSDSPAVVRALIQHGGNIWAGGEFSSAGGTSLRNIAIWNGITWASPDTGIDGAVYGLASSGTELFAVGRFLLPGIIARRGVARWDGSHWTGLGQGITSAYGYGLSAAVFAGELYVGGFFNSIGGVPAEGIARWNGNSWTNVSEPFAGPSPLVTVLASLNGALFAGGEFDSAGAAGGVRLSRWNGVNWRPLLRSTQRHESFVDGEIFAVAVDGSDVYVGGQFQHAGGIPLRGLAKWNGFAWSDVGGGVGGLFPAVYSILVRADEILVGGNFENAGGIPANNIARWNKATGLWSTFGQGLNGIVFTMLPSENDLYVGGNFTASGAKNLKLIARWSGGSQTWNPLGSGLATGVNNFYPPECRALVWISDGSLIVGGNFDIAGGVSSKSLARWNPTNSTWSTLGSLRGQQSSDQAFVSSLAVAADRTLYAGGQFLFASSTRATNIARMSPSGTWAALPRGGVGDAYSSVNALAVHDNTVYVGGTFTVNGTVSAPRILKFSGTAWSNLGAGISGGSQPRVSGLAFSGDDLFVGGLFSVAGDKPSENFARWNENGRTFDQPTIQSDRHPGGTRLWWNGWPGDYVVDFSKRLQNGESWIPLGTGEAAPGPRSFLDVTTEDDARFFRLRQLPAD
jgi:hypothetical protein